MVAGVVTLTIVLIVLLVLLLVYEIHRHGER